MAGRLRGLALAGVLVAGGSAAWAQPAPVQPVPGAALRTPLPRVPGYLAQGQAPDASVYLPPAPRPGSPTDAADLAAYRRTRALQGSARWRLAAQDANLAPADLMADFACALGVELSPANAPTLTRMIARIGHDAGGAAAHVKQVYQRPRPFVTHPGPICLPEQRQELAGSWSYPSGHSTYSWAVALVVAELFPDRAPAVLARARAYGESRVVCGVHYLSDVEEGRSVAAGVIAVLHADSGFQADLAQARAEIVAARSAGPLPASGQCRAEAAAIAETPPLATR